MAIESSPVRDCDLLIAGGFVVTLDGEDRIVPDGAIAIAGDRIAALGLSNEIEAAWRPALRIDARDRIVMPGLVNVHNHTPLMITRGMIEDLGHAPMFTAGVPQGHRLSEPEAAALSRLGVYEMLRTGCTTIVDFYRYPQALARAHADLGSRAIVAGRIHDADPEELTRKRYVYSRAIGEESLAENARLIEDWHGHDSGRIRCDVAPHAPDTCSDALLTRVREMAELSGRNVHTHLCQSVAEVEQTRARNGRSPAETLAEAGLLDDRLIAAHCIHVSDDDIELIGGSGAAIAYTPIGNAKTGRIAPTARLMRRGARMALCTDTFSGDMFEAMRWAVAMQRVLGDGDGLNAQTALRWATAGGAAALGLDKEIGSLEVGKKADIILLDRGQPTLAPVIDGYGVLVWSSNGNNVRTSIIDGKIVLDNGELTRVDGAAIVREAQAVAESLWRRAGREPAALAGAGARDVA